VLRILVYSGARPWFRESEFEMQRKNFSFLTRFRWPWAVGPTQHKIYGNVPIYAGCITLEILRDLEP